MLRRIISYLRRQMRDVLALSSEIRSLLLTVAVFTTVFEILKVLPPAIFTKIIDLLLSSGTADLGLGLMPELLVAYLFSLLVMNFLDIAGETIINKGILRSELDILGRIFNKLLSLDVRYHEQNETGRSINRLLRGQGRINELMWHLNLALLPATAQCLVTVCVLFYLGWELGVVFLAVVPIFLLLMFYGGDRTQPLREAYYGHLDEFSGSVAQSLLNVRTVKDFSAEQYEYDKAQSYLAKYSSAFQKRLSVGLSHLFIEDIVVSVGRVATLAVGIWLYVQGAISAGSLVLVMTLTEKAFLTLLRIHRVYFFVQDAEPAVTQFHKVLSTQPSVIAPESSPLIVNQGAIEFRGTSFSYLEGKVEAVKDLTIQIDARQTVAFVGRSGSGKTTLVKLLLRHFDPTSGEIFVDGERINNYSRQALAKAISVVSQDVELFNDTVTANLVYGLSGVTGEEIEAAARAAAAHDFIVNLVSGYDTIIGERGVKLSGGQKQRLAIARALLRKPKILIFDEATSSLDAEAERYIQQAIDSLIGQVTIIIIAHRFSTIERADMVFLLEDGKLLESGTHKDLLVLGGVYQRLRELQRI
jgi:ABC-type multidrug transport system fused ATPase/permease subunit